MSTFTGQHGQARNAQFNADLALSESSLSVALHEAALRIRYPDYIGVLREPSRHVPGQVDAVLLRIPEGKPLLKTEVEEKTRRPRRDTRTGEVIRARDVALEYAEVWGAASGHEEGSYKRDGWLWTTPPERLISYGWLAEGWVFHARAEQLALATEAMWGTWFRRYPVAAAPCRLGGDRSAEPAYWGLSLCVGIDDLLWHVEASRLINTREGRVRFRSRKRGRLVTVDATTREEVNHAC